MENLKLAKKLNTVAWIVSIVVILLVVFMNRVSYEVGADLSFLPMVNALLNTFTAILLLVALIFIKQKKVTAHRNTIYIAIGTSVAFLLCYVAYHITNESVSYQGEGVVKIIYLFILITHIILAALSFPFILFTFIRAYTGQIARHRKMARWVYPIWLYVAITGPVIYLMLSMSNSY